MELKARRRQRHAECMNAWRRVELLVGGRRCQCRAWGNARLLGRLEDWL